MQEFANATGHAFSDRAFRRAVVAADRRDEEAAVLGAPTRLWTPGV